MRDGSKCIPVVQLCVAAVFICSQGSWAQTAAPPRPIEIEPHTEAPAPPVKVPLGTLPLQIVRPPTPEELRNIVAYYVASTHTLHIRNAEDFDLGMRSGKFLATWTKGASKATVRGSDGSAISADVINDDLTRDTPPLPKVGDTRYVENEEIVSQAQQIENCMDFFHSFFFADMSCMSFLPKKFTSTKERLRMFKFPTND